MWRTASLAGSENVSASHKRVGTKATAIAAMAALVSGVVAAQSAETFSGSGIIISAKGEILTNAHVVEACRTITVKLASGDSEIGLVVVRDERNDLAVIRLTGTNNPLPSVAAFRDGAPLRSGDAIVALGYPLSGILATEANVSVGNVSALAGLADDSRYVQISAPVQPGNSGGPLLDASGHLVGIVSAKLDALHIARFTGDIPQNVNFALKAEVARTFLDSKGIAYQTARSDRQLSPADVSTIARPFTVHIECEQVGVESAAAPTIATPPAPNRIEATQQQVSTCTGQDVGNAEITASVSDLIIDACTAVIQSGPSAWAFYDRGNAYYRKGDHDRAIADYTEAIQLDPKSPFAYNNRGAAYNAKGDHDRAIADLTEAIRLDPKYARAYYTRGHAYSAKGDHDRAIADYDRGIALNPKSALAYFDRGLANLYAGSLPKALADIDRSSALDPKYPYTPIWVYIVDKRSNLPTRLADAVKQVDMTKWPAPVIKLYLGLLTPAAALAAADDPDANIKKGQVCEANFYSGELVLQQGRKKEAARLFRLAAADCPKNFVEWWAANAELKTLGAKHLTDDQPH